ncbi:putative ABC transport system permease protein [Mobilisporobacter senegalensis]|uniref:Putative ABC transport system permease protein n=1 Tax=Mobilisporobacter senegalensis TaxID=1329262 RepID=A0A3N1XKH6_9FIRM|nr:iron export ABC transporter permease subunit FetB [Mobilisporobacter senegalensis]ROR27219.1 putative ABC transport system permease protein [Mobilisporobacter senegalensis]
MNNIIQLNLIQFSLIYLLLLLVLFIMKKSKINQTRLLVLASLRMTIQLVLAGFVLTYIFRNPHPIFTTIYIIAMVAFAIQRVLSKNRGLNTKFKIGIAISIGISGILILSYFVMIIVGESLLNPQYTIPLAGMIIGNSMTGVTLAIKTFMESIDTQRDKIDSLLNLGVTPRKILIPYVNNALETALLPTMNSMLGMGIISLPGMMTGQILSGTLPSVAILYQISIMIAICTSVCLTTFLSLSIGYKSLYNKRSQINIFL